jgi:hypothetical protein
LDAPETLDIVFDFPRAVTGLLGDLAGGLLVHEPLGTDEQLCGRPHNCSDATHTPYFVALLNDKDQNHPAALAISQTLQGIADYATASLSRADC